MATEHGNKRTQGGGMNSDELDQMEKDYASVPENRRYIGRGPKARRNHMEISVEIKDILRTLSKDETLIQEAAQKIREALPAFMRITVEHEDFGKKTEVIFETWVASSTYIPDDPILGACKNLAMRESMKRKGDFGVCVEGGVKDYHFVRVAVYTDGKCIQDRS